MPKLADKDIIKTMRLLLATVVAQHGVLNQLVLTRKQIESVAKGELSVEDRPDGSIVLKVKGAKSIIRVN